MSRYFLALYFFLTLTLTGHAQMQKGSWMADGRIGLSFDHEGNESAGPSQWSYTNATYTNQFSVSPGLGYFIRDNFALGLSPIFTLAWNKYDSGYHGTDTANSYGYGAGLFSRRYIPAGDKVSFYGELRVAGVWGDSGWSASGSSDRTVSSRSRELEATASVGIQFLATDFLGLHMQSPLVSYTRREVTTEDLMGKYTNSNLGARLLSSFQIGASFFF